ncbi:phenazine biosynthesis-like domain-containing protein 2 isoform X2 [Penaeus japonicus]|nr:phenazine biosynthesis-like domain-containing protein 2 isoform X2 [Penaeus japonicus]XP_042883441.1 phenazine biosynthesis-like domain-containing protein 2 isoform X2 [Penaeus japonicus]
MQLKIFTVDAFTGKPFSGNQAAVVPLSQNIDDATMQKIATEMNLSETSFLAPLNADGPDAWTTCSQFSLRWFTPVCEIVLCGHATLAAAHVIFQNLGNTNNQLEFQTLSGTLIARKENHLLLLDFPENDPLSLTSEEEQTLSPLVEAVLGEEKPRARTVAISRTLKYLMVQLDDGCTRHDLENIRPDSRAMERLHDGSKVKAVIVCVKGRPGDREDAQEGVEKEYDVLSRFFAPWYGVDEDPVTGSAHTVLGPFWSRRLGHKELSCYQCSPRGGKVVVRTRGDGRVDIIGQAVTVITGHLNL